MIGPTPGEGYLDYIGLPAEYPHGGELARDLDDAIMDAIEYLMGQRKQEDPLLRVMTDDRCVLWERAEVPIGWLPIGATVWAEKDDRWEGRIRPADGYERERYPGKVAVDWARNGPSVYGDYPPGRLVDPDQVVAARMPVPLDLSALLAIIDAEQPPRPAVEPSPAAVPQRRAAGRGRARRGMSPAMVKLAKLLLGRPHQTHTVHLFYQPRHRAWSTWICWKPDLDAFWDHGELVTRTARAMLDRGFIERDTANDKHDAGWHYVLSDTGKTELAKHHTTAGSAT